MKVLVVDDSENIRALYKDELEEAGYEVFLAEGGEEALRLLEKVNPDIVTLDIRMLGISGIEVLKKIKEFNNNLPVIMCTAYDHKDDFNVWASEAYIVKSSNLNELKETIKKLLGSKNR